MIKEEIPIEVYLLNNGDKVKYVRYEDYKKLHSIIEEAREYIEEDYDRNEEVVDYCGFKEFYKHILEILDKAGDEK